MCVPSGLHIQASDIITICELGTRPSTNHHKLHTPTRNGQLLQIHVVCLLQLLLCVLPFVVRRSDARSICEANLQGHLDEQAHPREQDDDDVERVEHCAREKRTREKAGVTGLFALAHRCERAPSWPVRASLRRGPLTCQH